MGKSLRHLLLLAVPCILSAQTSLNVQLLGNYQGHREANPNNTYYSSVWGYTDVDGREYAIIGCYRGTAVVDLSYLPDSLHEAAFIAGPTASYSYREFKTYLHYLYIVSEGGGGIQIVDLAGLPNSVTVLSPYVTPLFDRAHTISETSGFLYVNGGNSTLGSKYAGGTTILSLANPIAPFKMGTFAEHYVHDSYTRNDTMFAAGIQGIGLSLLDVRNKSTPQFITTIQYPGAGTHNGWTTDDGRYVLTTDEIGSTPKTLKIWDIRDVNTITKVAEWDPRPSAIIHNVIVKGTFAYCAFYKAGLVIADISDITNPTLAGYYDTFPDSIPGFYNGAWGVYPLLPSGKILVSDMTSGLYVLGFNVQQIGLVRGTVTDQSTGQPASNAIVRIKETGQTRWTNSLGEFTWGYAGGNYTLTVERTGNQPKVLQTVITPGSVTNLSVSLPIAIPSNHKLYQNYPNPFNPTTRITFDLPSSGNVTLKVYDILGRELRTLVKGFLSVGQHEVEFRGDGLPSGVYIYRVSTPDFSASRRMVIVR